MRIKSKNIFSFVVLIVLMFVARICFAQTQNVFLPLVLHADSGVLDLDTQCHRVTITAPQAVEAGDLVTATIAIESEKDLDRLNICLFKDGAFFWNRNIAVHNQACKIVSNYQDAVCVECNGVDKISDNIFTVEMWARVFGPMQTMKAVAFEIDTDGCGYILEYNHRILVRP